MSPSHLVRECATRRRLRRAGIVPLVVLLLGLTACAGDDDGDDGAGDGFGQTTTTSRSDDGDDAGEPSDPGGGVPSDPCSLLSAEELETFLGAQGAADAAVTRDELAGPMTCAYTLSNESGQTSNFVHVAVFGAGDYEAIVASYDGADAMEDVPDLGDQAVRFVSDGPTVVVAAAGLAIILTAGSGLASGESATGVEGLTALAGEIVDRL